MVGRRRALARHRLPRLSMRRTIELPMYYVNVNRVRIRHLDALRNVIVVFYFLLISMNVYDGK